MSLPCIRTIFLRGEWEIHAQGPGGLPLDPTQHLLGPPSQEGESAAGLGGLLSSLSHAWLCEDQGTMAGV